MRIFLPADENFHQMIRLTVSMIPFLFPLRVALSTLATFSEYARHKLSLKC